ncbi:MAG: carbohydrate-binding family 9-like protein [Planctomycetota bacterium]
MLSAALTGGCASALDRLIVPKLTAAYTPEPPSMTADPQDSAWTYAQAIQGLSLVIPVKDGLATYAEPLYPTQVQALWDASALYLRFRCTDPEPYAPFDGHDDPHHQGDVVEVFIDPVGDARQWYEFQFSPRGDVLDKRFVMSAPPVVDEQGVLTSASRRHLRESLDWDAIGLRVSTRYLVGQGGADAEWIVDAAIPAGVLTQHHGGGPLTPMTLWVNFVRNDRPMDPSGERRLVSTTWVNVLAGRPHVSPKARGQLVLRPAVSPPEEP